MKDDKKKKSLDDLKGKDVKVVTPDEQKKIKGGDGGDDDRKGTDPLPGFPD